MDITDIRTTQDGRRVEVMDGWVCLTGVREANRQVSMAEHLSRQAITQAVPAATHVAGRLPLALAEVTKVQNALTAAQRVFDASPNGIT